MTLLQATSPMEAIAARGGPRMRRGRLVAIAFALPALGGLGWAALAPAQTDEHRLAFRGIARVAQSLKGKPMSDVANEFNLIADETILSEGWASALRPLRSFAGFFRKLTKIVPPLLVVVLLIAIW